MIGSLTKYSDRNGSQFRNKNRTLPPKLKIKEHEGKHSHLFAGY